MDGFIWNKGGLPPFKRSAIKRNTNLTRASEKTSQANEMSDFTSEMERKRNETTSQARLLEFGEDVKKRLRLLSEVALRAEK
jgi:hypothetical protein